MTKNMHGDKFHMNYAVRAIIVWFQVPFKFLLFYTKGLHKKCFKGQYRNAFYVSHILSGTNREEENEYWSFLNSGIAHNTCSVSFFRKRKIIHE